MSMLKEYPWLFANGKFLFKTKDNEVIKLDSYTYFERNDDGVIGWLVKEPKNELWSPSYQQKESKWYNIENCTLMARPMSGMGDDEYHICLDKMGGRTSHNMNTFIDWIGGRRYDSMNRDSLLYLLSIGVYPFDQSHFEDGTVLNINEVE